MRSEQQLAMPWRPYVCAEVARLLGVSWLKAREMIRAAGLVPTGCRSMRGVLIAPDDLGRVRAVVNAKHGGGDVCA